MSDTTLIVMRHGNTFNPGDTILRVGSATDLPLTETGLNQGFAAGVLLKKRGWIPAAVFCAPLLRTRQSAEKAIEALGGGISLAEADFLTELNYGEDDGKPEDAVVLRLGRAAAGAGSHSEEELRALGKAELARWDKDAVLPAGWNHLGTVVSELESSWRNFGLQIATIFRGQTVLAVTSNGIARFSRALLNAEEPPPENGLKLSTGALGVYKLGQDGWHCSEWNLRPDRM